LKKDNSKWKIREFIDKIGMISFPEYQREPNVWDLKKRQRLIDSILRGIDISSIYLYRTEDNYYDCVDGRQRINAILSYANKNAADDQYNGFSVTIINEIYKDDPDLEKIRDMKIEDLPKNFLEKFYNYEISVVELSEAENPLELNLFFLRLQLGQILNSGEKLNAMAGEMRDFIFKDLKNNLVFNSINVRYRRFTREQIAAQIVLNYFNKYYNGEYHRSRYVDLLEFFKDKVKLDQKDKELTKKIKSHLETTAKIFDDKLWLINNKALVVSVVLLVCKLIDNRKDNDLKPFSEFFEKLIKTLRWQIPLGVEMDESYKYISLEFQIYITQAADEKQAVEKREAFLEKEFDYFRSNKNMIRGDLEYEKKHGKSVDALRDSRFNWDLRNYSSKR
jgi:hypothetical protein